MDSGHACPKIIKLVKKLPPRKQAHISFRVQHHTFDAQTLKQPSLSTAGDDRNLLSLHSLKGE